MSVFGVYSRYYDLLYRDKDYPGETEYLAALLTKNRPGGRSLLNLGCGTGRHDVLLAAKGYDLCGVDRSEEMLERARSVPVPAGAALEFVSGDIRAIRLGKKFDAVLALFHVISYQTENSDVEAVFATAREHLDESGVFLFDVWYGPAVLTERPAVRVKRLANDEISVLRIAEPQLHPNENIVDVQYTAQVCDKASGKVTELRETHRMRYFFVPEIKRMLQAAGFELVRVEEWMTGKAPGLSSWGVLFVARRSISAPV